MFRISFKLGVESRKSEVGRRKVKTYNLNSLLQTYYSLLQTHNTKL